MKTSRTRIARTVAEQTLKNGLSKDFAREVAAYLLHDGRVDELESLLRDVQVDWAAHGYVEVLARSAHPLTADSKAEITSRVQRMFPAAQTVVVTEIADPGVLGGVEITVTNQQLDLSVEAKLNKFKQLTRVGKD